MPRYITTTTVDFSLNPEVFAPTKPIGDVPVYVDTRTGKFCANVPEKGYVERVTLSALARVVGGDFKPFDAIVAKTESWRGPLRPRRVRVTGYRKNPSHGGRWYYLEYRDDGALRNDEPYQTDDDLLRDEPYQTDDDLLRYDAATWERLRALFAVVERAQAEYATAVDAAPTAERPAR